MAFDYTLKLHCKADGKVITIGYQQFLAELGAADIPIEGQPLKHGGVPQVARLLQMVKERGHVTKAQAYFGGQLILEA